MTIKDKILSQPDYYIEGVNSMLYTAIMDYMEDHNLTEKEVVEKLNLTDELSTGDFKEITIEKFIEICLAVDKPPIIVI